MLKHALTFLPLYLRARAASRHANARGLPGMEFSRFGRRLGRRFLLRGRRRGAIYLLNPVSNVRYFEFDFAASCLPGGGARFLDVSSPRLFSLYVAHARPDARIEMLNPDPADIADTRLTCAAAGIGNVITDVNGVDVLPSRPAAYDCIWSISVIEHIAGDYDDRDAIRMMFGALKPGGRLILTIPVDRVLRDEYRDSDYYGTQHAEPGKGKYFFARHYDLSAIRSRLIDSIQAEPRAMRWFGEKTPGRWNEYEQRWMRQGLSCAVDDPREMADHYQEYPSWESMPGWGVAGLMFEKP